LLGVDSLTYFNSLVVQAAVGRFGASADGFLSAFRVKALDAGLPFNQAFNNVEFVGLVNTFNSLGDATSGINALDVVRMQLISRLGLSRFAGQSILRASVSKRYFQVTRSQLLIYKTTGIRFTGQGGVILPGSFGQQRDND
jgi:hypothetical protein